MQGFMHKMGNTSTILNKCPLLPSCSKVCETEDACRFRCQVSLKVESSETLNDLCAEPLSQSTQNEMKLSYFAVSNMLRAEWRRKCDTPFPFFSAQKYLHTISD